MSVTKSPSGTKSYFTTANTFEKKFGYHRAVRKGPFIFVAGTTALNPDTGEINHPNDAFLQASAAMARCIEAVKQLGGKLEDLVRVRMFVARHDDSAAVGQAFRDHFAPPPNDKIAQRSSASEIGSVATMIIVKDGFVDKEMLVEVEVDAVVG